MAILHQTIVVAMLAVFLVFPAESDGSERPRESHNSSSPWTFMRGEVAVETGTQGRIGRGKAAGTDSAQSDAVSYPTRSFLPITKDEVEASGLEPREGQKPLAITGPKNVKNSLHEPVNRHPGRNDGSWSPFRGPTGIIQNGSFGSQAPRWKPMGISAMNASSSGGDGKIDGSLRLPRTRRSTHPPSSCPGVFSYLKEGPSGGKWLGVIQAITDVTRVGVKLAVQLDKPAILLGAWLGEVKTENKKNFLIQNNEKIITPDSPLPVKILVQYDENSLPPPRIIKITLNGIQICPKMAAHNKESNGKKSSASSGGDQKAIDHEIVDGVECGQIDPRPSLLIAHGQPTERGDWPWHAAIYESTRNNLKYICGGSVIGKKMILTAAHCVSERRGRKDQAVSPETRVVFLGKFFLKGLEEGIQTKEVEQIHVHPEYSSIGYEADIAVMIVSSPIEFTEYVKPVCLWDGNRPHFSEIEGRDGVAVGWGFDENGVLSESLAMASMPVVSQQTCIWSNPQFFSRYLSDRTFCAGYRNGTSVCNGDSGGGMFFAKRVPGKTDELISPLTWTIRGIVSLGVSQETRKICDTSHYAIFADVAKYYYWIKQYH